MARPQYPSPPNPPQGWHPVVQQLASIVLSNPFPPAQYEAAALPAASSYTRCLAVVQDENRLAFSDGSSWQRIATTSDVEGTITGNLGSTANSIVRTSGTSGSIAQGSSVTIDDSGNVVVPASAGVVIGGATTSGVKLKVDTGTLVVREGDDSAYANLAGARVQVFSGSTIKTDLFPGTTGLSSDSVVSWSSTTASSGSKDVGVARHAAGTLKVTDGSTGIGTLRSAQIDVTTTGDARRAILSNDTFSAVSGYALKWTSSATDPTASGADLGLKRAASGVLQITDGSTGSGALYVATGTTTVPSITTATDTDTGISIGTSDNVLSLISGGAPRVAIGGSQVNFSGSTAYNWASRLTTYTSDTTLSTTCVQGVSTNEGAAGEVILTLPTAAAGLYTEAVVATGQYLRLKAAAGDTIRDAATVSASAGYIRANTQGNTIRLLAINATEWIVVAKQGTWTIDS